MEEKGERKFEKRLNIFITCVFVFGTYHTPGCY